MATRPSMHARDSSGRRVSLLNDEPSGQKRQLPMRPSNPYYDQSLARSNSNFSGRSNTSSPHTPSLTRADSFDSNQQDPMSPITPILPPELGRQNSYTSSLYNNKDQSHYDYQHERFEEYSSQNAVRHTYPDPQQALYGYGEPHMYEEESYQNPNTTERGGPKRYPCRYRDSHGCEKTFTTSGHASRHSKIHTAEKAVSCTWAGCQKKFTRADNMKQHLETHNKDRSRSGAAAKTGLKTLTLPAGITKPSSSSAGGRISRPSSRSANTEPEQPPVDPALSLFYQTAAFPSASSYASHSPAGPSASSQHHLNRLSQSYSPQCEGEQSGLDALAFAADYQQSHT